MALESGILQSSLSRYAATLGGVAIGAAAGGIIGALTEVGVPEEEARYYQREFEVGRVIVTVRADSRDQEARDILRQYGARDATDRAGTYDPTAPGTRRDDANAPGTYDPTAPGARRTDTVGTPGPPDTGVRTETARPNVGTRTYDADAPVGSTNPTGPDENPVKDDTPPPDRPQGR